MTMIIKITKSHKINWLNEEWYKMTDPSFLLILTVCRNGKLEEILDLDITDPTHGPKANITQNKHDIKASFCLVQVY